MERIPAFVFVTVAVFFGWLLKSYEPNDITSRVLVSILALVCFLQAIVLLMLVTPDQPAKDKHAADDSASGDNQSSIFGPSSILLRLRNKFKTYRKKSEDREYRKERRERWTVFGLFSAAAFALLQWEALRNTDDAIHQQLVEMRRQTETTRAQIRANLAPDDATNIIPIIRANNVVVSWSIGPRWKNTGATEAKELRDWFKLSFVSGDASRLGPGDCPVLPIPDPLPEPVILAGGRPVAMVGQQISAFDVVRQINGQGAIFVVSHLQYRDIFPDNPLHTLDVCDRVYANDLEKNSFSFVTQYMRAN